ncbi:SIS domain-containing protein [Kitasatospora cineracea]|uniref:D-sedoheptulose-7-phosphate isomerase n=1 Tax=Kitasatospora cineracea TaxID=88074 RepID=UPI0033DD1820
MNRTTDHQSEISAYLENLRRAIDGLSVPDLLRVAELVERTHLDGRVVYTCGNGGSAATASHLAVDLAKGARASGAPPLRTVSLVDHVAALTAWANDVGYDAVFSGQLEGLAEPGDLLLAISTSGNSPNVLAALRCARGLGLRTAGLLGPDGGRAAELCDAWVAAPAARIEEQEDIHMTVAHLLTRCLRNTVRARAVAPLGAPAERHR